MNKREKTRENKVRNGAGLQPSYPGPSAVSYEPQGSYSEPIQVTPPATGSVYIICFGGGFRKSGSNLHNTSAGKAVITVS